VIGLDVSLGTTSLLMGAAFVAGFVDSIAGGGGLITVPSLMIAGASPLTALATNKVQGLFGAASATVSYARGGHVDPRRQIGAAAVGFLAAVCGALLTSHLPAEVIRMGLPVVLIGIALFFAVKPGLNDVDRVERMRPAVFTATVVPLVGFYDGLIGPGAGAFYMLGFVALAGYGVLKATAHTKLINFASNCGGMAVFAFVAAPWWVTGVLMAVAQVAGATVGSRLAMRVGAKVIKPVLVVMSSALAMKLLWDQWG
jgi:uncharacterized protein